MSQAVLMSIKPEWVEKIFCAGKAYEMRKTKPSLQVPFKVYVYCTYGKTLYRSVDDDEIRLFDKQNVLNGKVMGEFMCYDIEDYPYYDKVLAGYYNSMLYLDEAMIDAYGKGKPLYLWAIWDRVVYDKPKELSEFKRWNRTEDNAPCAHTKALYEPCETCTACNVSRPPQSWMYVEELK